MEKENIIWTVPEVAKYLGCNVSSICKLVRNGQIPVGEYRSKLNFSKSSIDKWIGEQETKLKLIE